MKSHLRQFVLVFLTISSLVMVGLAVGLPLGGHSTAYISNKYYSAITPAGWAFSIWSVIYSGVIAFAVWQALPNQRQNAQIDAAAPYIALALIANGLWLPAWHYEQLVLSLIIIFIFLFALIKVVDVFASPKPTINSVGFWLGFVLFSVFAGWLTIATTINFTVVIIALKVPMGLPDAAWGVIILTIAFLIAWFLYGRWQSPAYFLVITWGFCAVATAHQATMPVFVTALALGALAAALAARPLYMRQNANAA
jgi:MFS family permease